MQIALRPEALYRVQGSLGVSRDELARRMRVATSTAFRVEKGDVAPSTKFIASLMHVSGEPFEALFEIVGREAAA